MLQLHEQYPAYGFAQHKGYGTEMHLAALREHGVTPHHRRSFAPVRERVEQLSLFPVESDSSRPLPPPPFPNHDHDTITPDYAPQQVNQDMKHLQGSNSITPSLGL